jgi:hypothetical protein
VSLLLVHHHHHHHLRVIINTFLLFNFKTSPTPPHPTPPHPTPCRLIPVTYYSYEPPLFSAISNSTDEDFSSAFMRMTISAVPHGSYLLWLHVAFVGLFMAWVSWLLMVYYREFIGMRIEHDRLMQKSGAPSGIADIRGAMTFRDGDLLAIADDLPYALRPKPPADLRKPLNPLPPEGEEGGDEENGLGDLHGGGRGGDEYGRAAREDSIDSSASQTWRDRHRRSDSSGGASPTAGDGKPKTTNADAAKLSDRVKALGPLEDWAADFSHPQWRTAGLYTVLVVDETVEEFTYRPEIDAKVVSLPRVLSIAGERVDAISEVFRNGRVGLSIAIIGL